MRVLPFALLLCLTAGAARAETWRILHWDRFNMVAVDGEHRRTTGLGNPALPVLELTLHPGSDNVEARIGEQEVDCADQRVRSRTDLMYFGANNVTALNTEIQPWRDPGQERDRMLVRALCKPDGLDHAPTVHSADIHEAMAAHLAASRTPKALASTPAWAAAWSAFADANRPGGIPTIELAIQTEQPFVIAAIADDGAAILLSAAIEKAGDLRYRYHELHVGPHARPDVVAVWALREADCGMRRTRTVAWAGFDAEARKKFGYDTNNIGTSFETPRPNSSDEIVMQHVCGATRLIAGKLKVEANLREAIAAYRWFIEGDDAAGKGVRNAARWRDAYVNACPQCMVEGDENSNARSANSSRAGSHS